MSSLWKFGVCHELIRIVKGGGHETIAWLQRPCTLPLHSLCKILLILESKLVNKFSTYNSIFIKHMFCFVLFWHVLSLTSNHATQIYVSIFKMGSQVRHTYLNSKSSIINGNILVTVESVEVKKYQTLQSWLDYCHSMCCRHVDHL